jgi:hypothetical protein
MQWPVAPNGGEYKQELEMLHAFNPSSKMFIVLLLNNRMIVPSHACCIGRIPKKYQDLHGTSDNGLLFANANGQSEDTTVKSLIAMPKP